jgi:hypothetical protein
VIIRFQKPLFSLPGWMLSRTGGFGYSPRPAPAREAALARLHELLVRIARREVARRAAAGDHRLCSAAKRK